MRARAASVWGVVMLVAGSAGGQAMPPPAPMPAPVMPPPAPVAPSHLSAGDQYFDASLRGFRDYLETQRQAEPALYAELAPELARLRSRSTGATLAMIIGSAGAVGSVLVPLAMMDKCTMPSLDGDAFDAYSDAMDAYDECTDRNNQRLLTGMMVAPLVLGAGFATFVIVRPKRRHLLELVNHHNRLKQDPPLSLQLGYLPTPGFASARLSVRF